jgi:hypothetical protein
MTQTEALRQRLSELQQQHRNERQQATDPTRSYEDRKRWAGYASSTFAALVGVQSRLRDLRVEG